MNERERIRAERREARERYAGLYQQVSDLLFRLDPIGLSAYAPKDEYEPEVGTILPRLRGCATAVDVQRVVSEEFSRWFGPDAGDVSHYEAAAKEIWELVRGTKWVAPSSGGDL